MRPENKYSEDELREQWFRSWSAAIEGERLRSNQGENQSYSSVSSTEVSEKTEKKCWTRFIACFESIIGMKINPRE